MKKNRYILIVLTLVASVFAFEYYFIAPKSEMLRESIETGYNALLKDEQFIKGTVITGDDIKKAADDMKNMEKRLIREQSEFLTFARLQGEVSDISEKAGLKVLTIRPLAAAKLGNYSNIPIYFEGNGNIKQISELLRHIESGSLLIKIDKINLNITNMQNPMELKFKIQVSGLAKLS